MIPIVHNHEKQLQFLSLSTKSIYILFFYFKKTKRTDVVHLDSMPTNRKHECSSFATTMWFTPIKQDKRMWETTMVHCSLLKIRLSYAVEK